MPHSTTTRGPAPSRPPTSTAEPGSRVVAILPSRGIGREVGLVTLDTDSGQVQLTQFADSPTWVKSVHRCRRASPKAILLPQTALAAPREAYDEVDDDGLDADTPAGPAAAARGPAEAAMLVNGLQRECSGVPLIPVLRKYWNEQAGTLDLRKCRCFEFLVQLAVHDDERLSTLGVCKTKWYALSAVAALFEWLDSTQSLSFPPNSLRICYAPLEGTCFIDTESAKNLELVSNLLIKKSRQHLLGMLNHCFTPMGTRLVRMMLVQNPFYLLKKLRANILSPLTDPAVIDGRLDAVDVLVNSEERFRAVRKALEVLKSLDLDKIVSNLLRTLRVSLTAVPTSRSSQLFPRLPISQDPSVRIAQHLSHLLQLRTFLSSLPKLRAAVEGSESRLLQAVEHALRDERLDWMAEVIEGGVNKDVWATQGKREGGTTQRGGAAGPGEGAGGMVGRHARLFAIKAERKLLLDVARETYRENVSDAYDLVEVLRSTFELDSIQMIQAGGSPSGGHFLFTMNKDEWEDKKNELSRAVTNVITKGKKVEFSSLELQKRNARLHESVEEILLMSEEILIEIFSDIRGCLGSLYKAVEVIAMLDMLASFAEVSGKNEYIRPEWTDTLAIKSGRHPLHEQFRISDGSFVPNDTYASDAASFQLIYGANMAGKSALLRQIALLHVMAQIGCFVPALYASFRPISALLTRLSNDDDVAASLSTFASEMSTMSMILGALAVFEDRQGAHCLVLVDELGRGTSPEEGVGIAHAIAEELIKSRAFTFFATHLKELAVTLPSRYPNVVSLHLETEINEDQPDFSLTFRHRVRDGVTPLTHYGLELAKAVKLPPRVLNTARIASLTLESLARDGLARSADGRLARRRRALLELTTTLKDLSTSTVTDADVLRSLMIQLQNDTVVMLAETMLPPTSGPEVPVVGTDVASASVREVGGIASDSQIVEDDAS